MKATFHQICQKIYEQYRRNQAQVRGPQVDVLATLQHADRLHQMIQDSVAAHAAIPIPVKYDEKHITLIGMDCRHYECGVLIFPRCELNVCIATGYKSIFAIPDYEALTYFCLLRGKSFPFPTVQAMEQRQKLV